MLNPQNPFAFEHRQHLIERKKRQSIRTPAIRQFSKNIKGICPGCRTGYQKLRLYDKLGTKLPFFACPHCYKVAGLLTPVINIPENLRPWKIISEASISPDAAYYFNRRFSCRGCSQVFADFYTFGALCNHKTHTPPNGYFCRLCCTKESTEKEKAAKLEKAGTTSIASFIYEVGAPPLDFQILAEQQANFEPVAAPNFLRQGRAWRPHIPEPPDLGREVEEEEEEEERPF